MDLLPVYLRKEPTTDPVLLKYAPEAVRFDVVAYADAEATKPKARWPWHYKSRPTRRNRRVYLNCFPWAVQWLPTLNATSGELPTT